MPRQNAQAVIAEMKRLADPKRAAASKWFFKTGKGEYGEGDIFLGIRVPAQRAVAKRFTDLPLGEARMLLMSSVHEHRLTGLFILVGQYERADEHQRTAIYRFYLTHARRVNNWDLVDSSAPHIVGSYLLDKPRAILRKLARSSNLWERRIAIIATALFIKHGQVDDTLAIARMLLKDTHDLIHKATGWMLREVGDRDRAAENAFLKKHAAHMPRTMLRYAIEKYPLAQRRQWMSRK